MSALKVCPSCGRQDSIFVPGSMAVKLNGQPVGGATVAFCNNTQCDQRYWYYPSSNRITRRHKGETYGEWSERQFKPRSINDIRECMGMPRIPAVIGNAPLLSHPPLPVRVALSDAGGGEVPILPSMEELLTYSKSGRAVGWLTDWRSWLAAYVKGLRQPFWR